MHREIGRFCDVAVIPINIHRLDEDAWEYGIEISVQGNVHPGDHRLKECQERGAYYPAPDYPRTHRDRDVHRWKRLGITGRTTETFVIRISFCPSDCRAVIEKR